MIPLLPYKVSSRVLLFFTLCTLIMLLPLATLAQQGPPRPPIIIEPMPPTLRTLNLEQHTIEARVDGSVASIHVTQRFRNPTQQTVEGTYIFPLPADAAIGDSQMTVDGQVLEGKLYNAQEARQIYEEIVRSQRDPALLEYMGGGLFQASVFPIPPGATRTVELTYRQILTLENGLYRLAVPVGASGHTLPQNFALSATLENQPGLRTIYSPSHNVSITRTGNDSAQLGLETTSAEEMRDFVLYFGTDESAIGLNLISYKPTGEDGFFLLLAAPALESASQEIVARNLVLVLDVSGSMEGEKIEQARKAARFVVEHLNPGDHFNLIRFSTGVDLWQPGLQPFNETSKESALAWIDDIRAEGSTDINRALLEALGQIGLTESTNPAYVLFLTDGLPTVGEQDTARIIANAEQNAPQGRTLRLFTFGVGYDVNTDLLDTLSRDMGGRSRYVRPGEAVDEAVSSFYAGISTPVLADVTITVEGAQLADTYPYPLPDLFAGEQLVWAGRYKAGGPVTVVVSGSVNGETHTFRYDDLALAEVGGESAVARLWATRKIGALLAQVQRTGSNQEIIDTIVDLSLTYGIVTPYTSFLVLEPTVAPVTMNAMPPMAFSMRADADSAVAEAVEESVAAAPAGMEAVESSIVRSQLEEATAVGENQGVRYVAGKSFAQQGTVVTEAGEHVPFWVDTLYEETASLRTVLFGSDDYFALVSDPVVAQWLSLSPEMVVLIDGEPIRITLTGTEGSESMPTSVSPAMPAVDQPTADPSVWQRFVNWVRNLFQ